jgi:ABC-type cobalamin/Fe3+-siderophores transport system ATPase subunit
MENWRDDLNSLIDETMAFVESVRVELLSARSIVELSRMPSVNWMSSEREEIIRRVANFKAHQQRFMREREDYVASEWKRMRASQHRSEI